LAGERIHNGVIAQGRCDLAPRQAEIQQFGAVFRQHYVAGLQIPMYYAGSMRSVERIGYLNAISQNLRQR